MIFCIFVTQLWPLIDVRFFSAQCLKSKRKEFHQISLGIDNVNIYSLGLLLVIFCLFVTGLWPLIDVRITYLLNTFITNGQNLICIDVDKI